MSTQWGREWLTGYLKQRILPRYCAPKWLKKNGDLSILSSCTIFSSWFFAHIDVFKFPLTTTNISDLQDSSNRAYKFEGLVHLYERTDGYRTMTNIQVYDATTLINQIFIFKIETKIQRMNTHYRLASIPSWALRRDTLAERVNTPRRFRTGIWKHTLTLGILSMEKSRMRGNWLRHSSWRQIMATQWRIW